MIPPAILISIICMHPSVRAEALIPQLGSRSFLCREKAGKELVALGRGSVAAIERNTKSLDPEIEERCKRLLPLAETEAIRQRVAFLLELPLKPVPPDVPLAKRLFAVTGDSLDARKLYVDIYLANAQLLDAIDKSGEKGSAVFWEWVRTITDAWVDVVSNRLVDPQELAPSHIISEGDVALFWLLSSDPEFQSAKNAGAAKQIARFDRSPAARDALSAKYATSLRRLFLARLGMPVDYGHPGIEATCVQQAFKLAADAKLAEARPIALKVALDVKQWHIARGAALMALMQIGSEGDIAEIQELIADYSVLGSSKAGSTTLGDVALATCVVLAHRELKDYGFKAAEEGVASGSADALHFGIEDDAQRKIARASWKQFRAKQATPVGGKR